MNLVQAVGVDQKECAYRLVGTLRIVVEPGRQTIRILVQRRCGRRWVIPEQESSIQYLNGVIRAVDGSWIVTCGVLDALEGVVPSLPAAYQHLLTPHSDDWHTKRAFTQHTLREGFQQPFCGKPLTDEP